MTPGEHLVQIAEAGIAISALPKQEVNLGILLDIENILDKGRTYSNSENRAVINAKMDELRGTIRDILDSMPSTEPAEFMIQRGRQTQNQFFIT